MIFKLPPDDFKSEVEVVACYLENDGEFVLLHRNDAKKFGDQFGLPAGKVDEGESITKAMQREICEETGVLLEEKDLNHFDTVYVRGGGSDFIYHMFSSALTKRPDIKLNPIEHKGFIWVSPEKSLELNLIHDLDECIKTFYKL